MLDDSSRSSISLRARLQPNADTSWDVMRAPWAHRRLDQNGSSSYGHCLLARALSRVTFQLSVHSLALFLYTSPQSHARFLHGPRCLLADKQDPRLTLAHIRLPEDPFKDIPTSIPIPLYQEKKIHKTQRHNMYLTAFVSALLGLSTSALALPSHFSTRDAAYQEAEAAALSRIAERGGNWNVVRNDLVNGPCRPVTVIFARGTIELGNVGSLAGPPFFNALTNIIGDSNVAIQGVDYPATIAGYLEGGDPAGAVKLVSLVNTAMSKCPNTQIILSGYR